MKYALSVLAISIFIQVKAQDPVYKDTVNKIHWVNQYPSLVKGNKSTNSGWFSKLLFGKKKEARIIKPMAVLKTNPDFYFVLDQGYGNIFKIRSKGEKITKLFKKSKFNFTSLVGFCITNDNDILFTDSRLNNVFKFNIQHKKLSVLNNHYKFKRPTGIAYSKVSNEIWVVETAAHRIVVLNNKGELIRSIGKRGTAKGEFNYPTSIWIDTSGKAYVIDALNFRIQIFNKEGKLAAEIKVYGAWIDLIKRKLTAPPSKFESIFESLPKSNNFKEILLKIKK